MNFKKYAYEPPSLSNSYKCPRCGAALKIPLSAPGQLELFPPNCHNCGAEMRPDNVYKGGKNEIRSNHKYFIL